MSTVETFAPAPQSKKRQWTGWSLTVLALLFLLVDALMKVARAQVAMQASVELGFSEASVPAIGILLLICTLLYAFPRTAILGAVLLTGYLGGAVATQVRAGNPLFSHVLFPVYFGALVWLGLYLRDRRLRQLLSSQS